MERKRRKTGTWDSKELIESLKNDSPSIKRRIEEESNIDEDYFNKTTSFFTLSGICVPRDVILFGVFKFLRFDYRLIRTIGVLNSSFYILILSNWRGKVNITRNNIHQISLLILRSTRRIRICKEIGKSELDYLFQTQFYLSRIKRISFASWKEYYLFFEIIEKRNIIFPETKLLSLGLFHDMPENLLIYIPEKCFPKMECLSNPPLNNLRNFSNLKIKKLIFGYSYRVVTSRIRDDKYCYFHPYILKELKLKSLVLLIDTNNLYSSFQTTIIQNIKDLKELKIESRFLIWKDLSKDLMKTLLWRNHRLETLSIGSSVSMHFNSIKYGNVFSTHYHITKLSLYHPTFPAIESAIESLPNLKDLRLLWNSCGHFTFLRDRFDLHDYFVRIFDSLFQRTKIPNWKLIVGECVFRGRPIRAKLYVKVKNGIVLKYLDTWEHDQNTFKEYIREKVNKVLQEEDHPFQIFEMVLSELNYQKFVELGILDEEKMVLKEEYNYENSIGYELVSKVYHKKNKK